MQTTRELLSTLRLDPENARRHPGRNLKTISESLTRFGQVEPLIVRAASRQVIGGNGRLEVMRRLGWESAECVLLDIGEREAKALALVLNRSGELAEWDFETLSEVLRSLEQDLPPGWEEHELEPLLQAVWTPKEVEKDLESFSNSLPSEDANEEESERPERVLEEDPEVLVVRLSGIHRDRFVRAVSSVRNDDPTATFEEVVSVLCEFACLG